MSFPLKAAAGRSILARTAVSRTAGLRKGYNFSQLTNGSWPSAVKGRIVGSNATVNFGGLGNSSLVLAPVTHQLITRQSISKFSTLNSGRPLVIHKHTIFASSRPILASPSVQLRANLSGKAKELLEDYTPPGDWIVEAGAGRPTLEQLNELGFSHDFWPTNLVLQLLEHIHFQNGLSWWVSIALLAAMFRITLFPLMLRSTQNNSRLPWYADQRKELLEKVKEAQAKGNDLEVRKLHEKMTLLHREWGFDMKIPIVAAVFQLVAYASTFFCIQKCARVPYPGWDSGGISWFKDLTVADPYYILPMVSGIIIFTNHLVAQRLNPVKPSGVFGMATIMLGPLSLILMPIVGSHLPAGLFVFFVVTNVFQGIQTLLFEHPYTRPKLNILPHRIPDDQLHYPPPRPGFRGIILDQRDIFVHCYKSWVKDIQARRDEVQEASAIANRSEAIEYGRIIKGKKAKAGLIPKEKLK